VTLRPQKPPPRNARTRSQWRISVVYWLSLLGIGIWTAAAASGRVASTPTIQPGPFFVVLLLAAANLAFRSWERVRRDRTPDHRPSVGLGWLFVTVDLILITAGLRVTGGIASPLWVVIFLVGVAETILANPADAHLIQYGTIFALIVGTLPQPAASADAGYFLETFVRVGCFLAVSSVTRRLRENNDLQERENASLRAELALADQRSQLSREVHDGVGNSLAASVLRLEVAARTLEKDRPGDGSVALLREEAQALREAMSSVRDWTYFTRPWSFGGGGSADQAPSASLVSEIERLSRRTGLPMTVTGAEVLDHLPAASRLAVLRIVQEALTNAAKHAHGAARAETVIERDGAWVLLQVADDGAGFAPEGAGTGVGLASMRERAEGAGGSFAWSSAPGLGTTLTARLPAE
jgi:signal transduction histidine kinase